MKIEVDPSIFLTYKAKDVQTRLSENPVCIDVKENPHTAAGAAIRICQRLALPLCSPNATIKLTTG